MSIIGWWQPKRAAKYSFDAPITLTLEELETVEYFRKNLRLGWATFFRMLLWEYVEARKAAKPEVIKTSQETTWQKIQTHVTSGKWVGLPDKLMKCVKDPKLNPRVYAGAAYAYGIHPDLSKLLHDYSLELMRGQATGILMEYDVNIEPPKNRR